MKRATKENYIRDDAESGLSAPNSLIKLNKRFLQPDFSIMLSCTVV